MSHQHLLEPIKPLARSVEITLMRSIQQQNIGTLTGNS